MKLEVLNVYRNYSLLKTPIMELPRIYLAYSKLTKRKKAILPNIINSLF